MSPEDPLSTGSEAKQAAALLREARSLQHRADRLLARADTSDEATTTVLAEIVAAAERAVHHLGRLEQSRRRQAGNALRRDALRGRRGPR